MEAPPVKTKKGFKDYMAEAQSSVDVIDVAKAMEMAGNPDVQFIDVRDRQELIATGCIPDAEHASRGLIEFLVDPESPYHNKVFAGNREFVVYCMSGGRSILAAQRMQEMGIERVHTLAGGLKAWVEAGGETQAVKE